MSVSKSDVNENITKPTNKCRRHGMPKSVRYWIATMPRQEVLTLILMAVIFLTMYLTS